MLLQRLAATLVPGLEARALGWLVQLLPIAFTFRIRANHEQAVLLCLVAALYGVERSRTRPRWALLTVAGLVGLLLVKGVLAVFGPVLCALWLLARRLTAPGPAPADRAAWLGLGAGVLAMGAAAGLYEQLYRQATGEPFWSFYLARQLGAAAAAGEGAGLAVKLYNLVWYLGRVLWFPFPWSLALVLAAWHARRLPWRSRPAVDRPAGGSRRPRRGAVRDRDRRPVRGPLQPLRPPRRPLHLPRLLRGGRRGRRGRAAGVAPAPPPGRAGSTGRGCRRRSGPSPSPPTSSPAGSACPRSRSGPPDLLAVASGRPALPSGRRRSGAWLTTCACGTS